MSSFDVSLQLQSSTSLRKDFNGVAAYFRARIVVCPVGGAGSESAAEALYDSLAEFLSQMSVYASDETPMTEAEFMALKEDDQNLNLLVIVGDNQGCHSTSLATFWLNQRAKTMRERESPFQILPAASYEVVESGQLDKVFPSDKIDCGSLNVASWLHSAEELTPQVLANSGVSTNEFEVFISYRQDDTKPIADQLFIALSKEGFSVFVDRFSVPRGIDFQRYLTEQMEDRAMIIFLESKTFKDSRWTRFEASFAKKRKLGLFAIKMPDADILQSIDEPDRLRLDGSDLEVKNDTVPTHTGNKHTLTDSSIEKIVQQIKLRHSRAFVLRRRSLREELEASLAIQGLACTDHGNGVLSVASPTCSRIYKIWLAPRPADLKDFYYAHVRDPKTQPPELVHVVVAPLVAVNRAKRDQLNWIKKKYHFRQYDPTMIPELARTITRCK